MVNAKYENLELPFQIAGNKQYLTDYDVSNSIYLQEFIKIFKNCFEYNALVHGYVFYEPSDDGERPSPAH